MGLAGGGSHAATPAAARVQQLAQYGRLYKPSASRLSPQYGTRARRTQGGNAYFHRPSGSRSISPLLLMADADDAAGVLGRAVSASACSSPEPYKNPTSQFAQGQDVFDIQAAVIGGAPELGSVDSNTEASGPGDGSGGLGSRGYVPPTTAS